jgi:hypothetical protein
MPLEHSVGYVYNIRKSNSIGRINEEFAGVDTQPAPQKKNSPKAVFF